MSDILGGYWVYPLRYGCTLETNAWVEWHFHSFCSSAFVAHSIYRKRRDLVGTAVLLWSESYRQNPAGTLPDDDVQLARLAGYGTDVEGWQEARRDGALNGWEAVSVEDYEGSEAFLGHRIIAEIAVESYGRKASSKQARAAQSLGNSKWKVKQKLSDIGRKKLAENNVVVTEVAKWLAKGGLMITAENVAVALEEVAHVRSVEPFPGPRAGEMK